jgi:hypothetical protein
MAYTYLRRWRTTAGVSHLDTCPPITFQRAMSPEFDFVDCSLRPSRCRNSGNPYCYKHHMCRSGDGTFDEAKQIGPK